MTCTALPNRDVRRAEHFAHSITLPSSLLMYLDNGMHAEHGEEGTPRAWLASSVSHSYM
jgi:hypothetical protein